MPLSALLLIIIAALFHATWNLVAKKSGGTTVFAFATSIVTAVIWTPIAFTLIKHSPQISQVNWGNTAWLMVFISAVIHSVYYVVLLHGYKVAPLSVVYPIARGTGPLLSSFIAIIIFNEELTFYTAGGVLFIVFGILLLTWTKELAILDKSSIRGIGWGFLTGFMISLYTLTDAYGVKTLGMDPLIFDYWSNIIRVMLLFPFAYKSSANITQTIKTNLISILIIAILGPTAYILVLSAIQIAPVSHVAPAREISMLFGAFFGGKILQEGHFMRRMIAAGLIGIGVCLLVG